MRTIKLNELDSALDDIRYPATRDTIIEACADITLTLADGTEPLVGVLAGSSEDVFDSLDEAANEILSLLPRRAVGEPYQSEGDA